MLNLLLNLSLLAFAGAFSPVLISICILLLSTGQPLANAIAYVLGLVFSLIVVGGLAVRSAKPRHEINDAQRRDRGGGNPGGTLGFGE